MDVTSMKLLKKSLCLLVAAPFLLIGLIYTVYVSVLWWVVNDTSFLETFSERFSN